MVQMQEIMEMSAAERILIIEKIWDSLDHDSIGTPTGHEQELNRRLARYEKGETAFFSWIDIKNELSVSK